VNLETASDHNLHSNAKTAKDVFVCTGMEATSVIGGVREKKS
jgi:hypothetical protein